MHETKESIQEMTERIKRLVPAYKAPLNETDKIFADNKAKKKAKSIKKAKIAKASRKRNRK